jgi:hypothetical protein
MSKLNNNISQKKEDYNNLLEGLTILGGIKDSIFPDFESLIDIKKQNSHRDH